MKSKKPKKPNNTKKMPDRSGYTFYTIKDIIRMTKNTNNWGGSAVDCLTKAFAENKKLAIKDRGIDVNKIPRVWFSLCDYIEIDGKVVKSEYGQQIKR